MPTPLPRGRRFWRRHAPSRETVANLVATGAEFVLALAFVAVAVLLIALATRMAQAADDAGGQLPAAQGDRRQAS